MFSPCNITNSISPLLPVVFQLCRLLRLISFSLKIDCFFPCLIITQEHAQSCGNICRIHRLNTLPRQLTRIVFLVRIKQKFLKYYFTSFFPHPDWLLGQVSENSFIILNQRTSVLDTFQINVFINQVLCKTFCHLGENSIQEILIIS